MEPTHIIFILLGASFVVVFLIVPKLLRRRSASLLRPGSFDPPDESPRAELEQLVTDIQEITREKIAVLDTKIRTCSQLLLECDQKKKDLEALLDQATATTRSTPESEPPPPPKPSNPLHDEVYVLKDSGKHLAEICSATGLETGEVELILGLRKMDDSQKQEAGSRKLEAGS